MMRTYKTILQLVFIFAICISTSCKQDKNTYFKAAKIKGIKLKDMFGINAFEWDFLQNPNNLEDIDNIYEPNMWLIKSFSQVRHYLDWEKLENTPGGYTFNPTHKGGWNLDLVYTRCKKENIFVVTCIKNDPDWLYKTYPANQRDNENVPAPYNANREKPSSYIAQAKAAFQFAARYGQNKNVDSTLVTVNHNQRWNGDGINTVKIGMDLIKYVECNNEPDKWWKGKKGQQSASEYAANLSAFYDGHKGTLGKNVGVKNADPEMKVVMGGLAKADLNYVKGIVQWCKENRGLNPDGSINLCFDVLNYHLYSNDNTGWFSKFISKERGVAPELNTMGDIADSFVQYAATLSKKKMEVWTTETGYDLQDQSIQKAIPIGSKSAEVTQGDWNLRTGLLYARHGISRVFFYQLFDTDEPGDSSGGPFGSSGLVTKEKRRPAANYFMQLIKLMGDYTYYATINKDPIDDIYISGKKEIHVLTVPDEVGRKEDYELDLNNAKSAVIYTLNPNSELFDIKTVQTDHGILKLTVTETPLFVQSL
jgi:hypothetical protein